MSLTQDAFKLSALDKINRAKIKLYSDRPFFSYLVMHLKVVKATDPRITTCGVTENGTLLYNEDFVNTMPINEVIGVLVHEVLHLAFKHLYRERHYKTVIKDKEGVSHSLCNIAADLIVNTIILKNGMTLPKCGLLPDIQEDKYTIANYTVTNISQKNMEEIYEELKNNLKIQYQNSSGGSGSGSEINASDVSIDKGLDTHCPASSDEEADAQSKNAVTGRKKDWEQILREANAMAQARGENPLGAIREFEDIGRSRIPWRAITRREITKNIPMDYTWQRPNRKLISQGIYMPSTTGEKIRVMFTIDTSGSMGKKELDEAMTEIIACSKAFPKVEMRLITHDAEVQDDYHIFNGTLDKLRRVEIHGGGGTDHVCVHEYIKEKKYHKDFAIMFHFTDGWTCWPDRPVIPTYIVLTGNYVAKDHTPPWSQGTYVLD